ncbi:MAG: FemAB family PEP-CTERM system-associated protein [Phycisphaerae bacterium]
MTNRNPANSSAPSPETVRVAVSSNPPDWAGYLARHEGATLLHDPRWGIVMQEAYGNRPYYLTARRGEQVVGILQLVLQKSLLFGTHLSSLPYFDASGILAHDDAAAEALLTEAASLRAQTGADSVELRHTTALPGDLPRRDDKVTLHLPLPDDPDTLWDALKSKVRSQVRKPDKEGLTLHGEGEATLEEFHAVYVRTMRDLGSPPHGRWFFEIIRDHFGDAVRLFSVRQDETPLAASFTLTDDKAMRVPWAAADWRYRKLGANMLLYWGMLKDGCERGAPCFDFGRSTEGSGTHRFKKQWGAEDVPLCWQYLLPEGESPPEIDPEGSKYRFLVGAWRRLPVFAARVLGPQIIGKLR